MRPTWRGSFETRKLKLELYTPETEVEASMATGVQSTNFSLLAKDAQAKA
jgi:hypothetical protein